MDKRTHEKSWEYMAGQGQCHQQQPPQTFCGTALLFFLPNTQKSNPCLCMHTGSNPGGCWHYQRGLSGSLHFLAIWLLLIKPCVYLLLLFWETTTTHCQSLSKQGNTQTHRQAHTLLAKLATKSYKDHNCANMPKCGRMFFLFTFQSEIRGRSGSGSHTTSTCQYSVPASLLLELSWRKLGQRAKSQRNSQL